MAKIRKEINISNRVNEPVNSDEIIRLEQSAFSGSVRYNLEIVGNNLDASENRIDLENNETHSSELIYQIVPVANGYVLSRSQNFFPNDTYPYKRVYSQPNLWYLCPRVVIMQRSNVLKDSNLEGTFYALPFDSSVERYYAFSYQATSSYNLGVIQLYLAAKSLYSGYDKPGGTVTCELWSASGSPGSPGACLSASRTVIDLSSFFRATDYYDEYDFYFNGYPIVSDEYYFIVIKSSRDGLANCYLASVYEPDAVGYIYYSDDDPISWGLLDSTASVAFATYDDTEAITATETQFEIGGYVTDIYNNEAIEPLPYPKYWYYDSSKWDGTVTAYGGASWECIDDMNWVSIYVEEDDGAFGNWTQVATIVNQGASEVVNYSESSNFTVTSGCNYRLAVQSEASKVGSGANIYNAKIIITQTSATGITKTESEYLLINTVSDLLLTTSGIQMFKDFDWEYAGGSLTLLPEHCATSSSSDTSEISVVAEKYLSYSSSTVLWSGSGYEHSGQSFYGNGGDLLFVIFKLRKVGSPTGSMYAKLYSHTGTFGSGTPLALLATSDAFDVSTLSTDDKYIKFVFSTPYTLINDTPYFIVVNYSAGSSGAYAVLRTHSSGWHYGNMAYSGDGSTWSYNSANDVLFELHTTVGNSEITGAYRTRGATGLNLSNFEFYPSSASPSTNIYASKVIAQYEYYFPPPTVELNTANETPFGGDTTPTLEFTGSDFESYTLEYNIQIDDSTTFSGINLLDKLSTTASGFLNTVSGTDTHPFISGHKISYTVQSGDALSDDTYYWRVKAMSSKTDEWGDWTSPYSFSVGTTSSGWSGNILGTSNPAKILGVDVANISKICGVS